MILRKGDVDVDFFAATVRRPWMRVKIFVDDGPLARTPETYKKFFYDWQIKPPSPVHYIPEPGNWKFERGEITLNQDHPIPLLYPNEIHEGIWGGEAVIKGYEQRHPKHDKVATYWVPKLKKSVIYSEILDKHMNITVTERALQLIDDNYGLDSYILKTPIADLYSLLALRLRKQMIYALMEKSFYPNDFARKEEVYEKYKNFVIPKEELEWFALTLSEAYRKQVKIEEAAKNSGPLKEFFRKEFIQYLKENPEVVEPKETKRGLLERLSFFKNK